MRETKEVEKMIGRKSDIISIGGPKVLETPVLSVERVAARRLRIDFDSWKWIKHEDGWLDETLRNLPWEEVKLCNARSEEAKQRLRFCLHACCANHSIESIMLSRCNIDPEMLQFLPRNSTLNEVHVHPLPPEGWIVAKARIRAALQYNQTLQSLSLTRLSNCLLLSILQTLSKHQTVRHLAIRLWNQNQRGQRVILGAIQNLKVQSVSYGNVQFTNETIGAAAMSATDKLEFDGCKFQGPGPLLSSTNCVELSLRGILRIDTEAMVLQSQRLQKFHVSIPNRGMGPRLLQKLFQALASSDARIRSFSVQLLDDEGAKSMELFLPKWSSITELNIVDANSPVPGRRAFQRNGIIVDTNIEDPSIRWYATQRNRHLPGAFYAANDCLLPRLMVTARSDLGTTQIAARLLTFQK